MDPLGAFFHYPINDYGPVMRGLVIGGLGILHVFLAQFAIGGGMLLCRFQWLAMRGKEPSGRVLLDSYFRVLVLVSFVVGALTGVAMWFTSIQISPKTIGTMVDEFHWIWATEWLFFWVEVIAGYAYYRYGKILSDRTRLGLLATYTIAGFGSLFWINGILSWQLTPGAWTASGNVWEGFFNPTFWPSLFYRTIASSVIAGIVAAVVVNAIGDLSREDRTRLVHRAAEFMVPIAAMPIFGIWFVWAMPADSRSWILGGSIAMTLFFNLSLGASALIGGYALIALRRQKLFMNGATATLLGALALAATAGGEFVREGARKPYTIRDTLYSNSISPDLVAKLRTIGSTSGDPYPLADAEEYVNDQLRSGALVFRNQCSVCHTVRGINGLVHLMGTWTPDQMRLNVAKLQWTKNFMPPFAGTPHELEALTQLVRWETAGRPSTWPESASPEVVADIARWLEEAGTGPASAGRASLPAKPNEKGR